MSGWRARAACRDVDPELFFPVGTKGPALTQIEEARAVCRRCPVATSCLEWAVTTGQIYGVLGATTPEERLTRVMRRSVALPAPGECAACGKPVRRKSRPGGRPVKYCSDECSAHAQRLRHAART